METDQSLVDVSTFVSKELSLFLSSFCRRGILTKANLRSVPHLAPDSVLPRGSVTCEVDLRVSRSKTVHLALAQCSSRWYHGRIVFATEIDDAILLMRANLIIRKVVSCASSYLMRTEVTRVSGATVVLTARRSQDLHNMLS